jgi:hypothetical protein
MPASTSCLGVPVAVAAEVGLLVVGRGGPSATPTAASTPSPSSLATTTAAATTTMAGALTGEELAWLEGLHKRHTKADNVLTDAPSNMTRQRWECSRQDARDDSDDRLVKRGGMLTGRRTDRMLRKETNDQTMWG